MSDRAKVYLNANPDQENLHFKEEDAKLIRKLRKKTVKKRTGHTVMRMRTIVFAAAQRAWWK